MAFITRNPFINAAEHFLGLTPPPPQASQNVPEQSRCCPAFQLEGEFLLDTASGRVWKYDERESAFVPIPKILTPIEHKAIRSYQDGLQRVAKDKKLEQNVLDLHREELKWMTQESRQW